MTDRARILVVSCGYPSRDRPAAGGFVRHQAELATRHFDVAVLVPQIAGWRELRSSGRTAGTELATEGPLTVCRTTAWHPPLRPPIIARLLLRPPKDARTGRGLSNAVLDLLFGRFEAAAARGARELGRRWGSPDLVHAHFVLPAGWLGLQLARESGAPLVLTEHSGPFENQIETPLRRRLARETLLGAARVLAVSPFQEERIRLFAPDARLETLGNPIRDDLFTPPPPAAEPRQARRFRFLAVASLVPLKGIDTLLRAAALLAAGGATDFELRIAGDGPERTSLEGLAATLELSSRLTFLGAVPPEMMPDTVRSCDALVLPSRHETFGMAVAEAMACGRPVIATRCGGPEHLVEPDTGILVEVDDSEELAGAMRALAAGERSFDPERLRASAVERFGADAMADRLRSLYCELLEPAAPRGATR